MNQEKSGKIIKKIRKEHHLTQKDLDDKYNGGDDLEDDYEE